LNVPRCSLVYLVVEYEVSTLLSKDGSRDDAYSYHKKY